MYQFTYRQVVDVHSQADVGKQVTVASSDYSRCDKIVT